jgi:hypothetical protein
VRARPNAEPTRSKNRVTLFDEVAQTTSSELAPARVVTASLHSWRPSKCLAKLDNLCQKQLIARDEYLARRKAILDEI